MGAPAVGVARLRSDARAGADTPHVESAVTVQVATATRRDVPVYLSGIGTVQAFNTVTVHTQVDGQLTQVLFTEGQLVQQGQLLGQIDPRSFQAAVDQAAAKLQQDQANLANAKLELGRLQNLAPKGFATVQGLDNQSSTVAQLTAQIAQDQAAEAAAAVQLSYTHLTAPITGRTGVRLIDAGNIVHATDPTGLVVITQTQPISVISTLPESALPLVRAAMQAGPVPVTALSQDGTVNLGSGTLLLIDNEINQQAGTINLKSTFPNADEALWPGQYVELRLQQQLAKDAITIPAAALQRGQQGFFAYVVGADSTVEARPLTLGQIADGTAIVQKGIDAGESVVISGAYELEPGVKVAVATAATR